MCDDWGFKLEDILDYIQSGKYRNNMSVVLFFLKYVCVVVCNHQYKIPCASAGSRTRVDCLEGNHANRYTTDATTSEQL